MTTKNTKQGKNATAVATVPVKAITAAPDQKAEPKQSMNKLFLQFGYNTKMRQDKIAELTQKYIGIKGEKPKIEEFADQAFKEEKDPKGVLHLIRQRTGRHWNFFVTHLGKAINTQPSK